MEETLASPKMKEVDFLKPRSNKFSYTKQNPKTRRLFYIKKIRNSYFQEF